MKYPITCVLGRRGSGKTLFMTALADQYAKEGVKVYANYHLKNIPYTFMSFKQLVEKVENQSLSDGVVFLDEIQQGADAYEFFSKKAKAVTTFATQIRKLHIVLYYSTQVFVYGAKRLRDQTNYIIECETTDEPGVTEVAIYDHMLKYTGELIREFVFDGRPYFGSYDTDELVGFE